MKLISIMNIYDVLLLPHWPTHLVLSTRASRGFQLKFFFLLAAFGNPVHSSCFIWLLIPIINVQRDKQLSRNPPGTAYKLSQPLGVDVIGSTLKGSLFLSFFYPRRDIVRGDSRVGCAFLLLLQQGGSSSSSSSSLS